MNAAEMPEWAVMELAQLKDDRDNNEITRFQYADLRRGIIDSVRRQVDREAMLDAGRIGRLR